jgi:hypothetical protein
MTTLDGKERALSTDDLCICDEKAPSALAGVMGGATSEVSDKTSRILLESAAFAPAGIRRTASRHALHSESSHRFERGVDPAMVAFAQDRAARLLAELCGGTVAKGRVDVRGKLPEPRRFFLRWARVGELLGTPVQQETTSKILAGLGFALEPKGDGADVTAPSWRLDVEGPADCVEEVARSRGYESIPAAMPRGATEILRRDPPPRPSRTRHRNRARRRAASTRIHNYYRSSPPRTSRPSRRPEAHRAQEPARRRPGGDGPTRLAGCSATAPQPEPPGRGRAALTRSATSTGRPRNRTASSRPTRPGCRRADGRKPHGPAVGAPERQPWTSSTSGRAAERARGLPACARPASSGVRPSLLHPRLWPARSRPAVARWATSRAPPSVAQMLDLPARRARLELRFDAVVAAAGSYRRTRACPGSRRSCATCGGARRATAAASVERPSARRAAAGGGRECSSSLPRGQHPLRQEEPSPTPTATARPTARSPTTKSARAHGRSSARWSSSSRRRCAPEAGLEVRFAPSECRPRAGQP